MLSDPQSVTINGTAISMPRISVGNLNTKYSSADGGTQLRVSHTVTNRERSMVRLDLSKIGADPLQSTISRTYSASVWLVIDRPVNGAGYTDTELQQAVAGFLTYLGTSGFTLKILGLES